MADPVRQFSKMGGIVGKSFVAAERLGDVFSEESEIREPSNPVVPNSCRGELEFRSVSFNYGAGEMGLRSISFHVEPGQTIALVGSTGAGKTTLVSLVPRFHDPVSGHVMLDRHHLRDLSLAFIRSRVALAFQETLVFYAPTR